MPSHSVISPELHIAVDFHGFVWLIWLYSAKQREQEGEWEKEITHEKLGYNNPRGLSETKKRRKVQHWAAARQGHNPGCSTQHSVFRNKFLWSLIKRKQWKLGGFGGCRPKDKDILPPCSQQDAASSYNREESRRSLPQSCPVPFCKEMDRSSCHEPRYHSREGEGSWRSTSHQQLIAAGVQLLSTKFLGNN